MGGSDRHGVGSPGPLAHGTEVCARVQVYFAAAMESGAYEAAMDVLDPLERTPDTEAQWLQLADAALAAVADVPPARGGVLLQMAERCYAAVGNLARAGYLRRVSAQHAAGVAGDALAAVRAEVRHTPANLRTARASQSNTNECTRARRR